jgi:hypothetical protein
MKKKITSFRDLEFTKIPMHGAGSKKTIYVPFCNETGLVAVTFKAASNNVIPAKAGIQKLLKSLDSRLRGSDKLIIIRGSLNTIDEHRYKLRRR